MEKILSAHKNTTKTQMCGEGIACLNIRRQQGQKIDTNYKAVMHKKLKPKLLFLVTEDWYFYSHRLPLAEAAKKAGYEVYLATRVHCHGQLIRAKNIHLIPICIQRSNLNVKNEFLTIIELINIYRRIRPDIVHHVAMKPVLYGSLVAFLTGVPAVVNAMAGLGFVFINQSIHAAILRTVVRSSFRILSKYEQSYLILQNADDARLFVKQRLIPAKRLRLIRGSGVNLTHFQPIPEAKGKLTVAMVGRMLRDKGVVELVEAASMLRAQGYNIKVILAGPLDRLNPTCLSEQKLRSWEKDELVEWWGEVTDVRAVWAHAHVAVLPSYREGLPKSLLEAAACCRPLVATDVPGCREIVRDGENGLLVPIRNPTALAAALKRLLKDQMLRQRMGIRSREIVKAEFSLERVVSETLAVYKDLLT